MVVPFIPVTWILQLRKRAPRTVAPPLTLSALAAGQSVVWFGRDLPELAPLGEHVLFHGRVIHETAPPRWVAASGAPLRDDDGNVVAIVGDGALTGGIVALHTGRKA